MDSSDPPPGPANLLDDALARPAATPPLHPAAAHPPPPPSKADDMAPSSSGSSARGGTPDAREGHQATTTITTVSDQGADGTTQTFTHVGADSISANYSSQTGQITLRPIPVKGVDASKIKTLRSRRTHFAPRLSHFDRHNTSSAQDPFRGFWTLFWITIALGGIRTGYRHFQLTGSPFGWTFASLISEDGWALALSDGVMVATTLLCVPYAKLLVSGWIRYYWTGLILQHIGQTAFLAIAVRWTFHRQWPWVQSGFMTLHALSLIMKVHSYCATIGEMSERARQLKKDEARLSSLLDAHGGRAKAEADARAAWEKACAETPSISTTPSSASLDLPPTSSSLQPPQQPSTTSSEDESTQPRQLRQRITRRKSADHRSPSRSRSSASLTHHLHPSKDEAPHEGPETLTWHPNEEISAVAIRVAEANEALTSVPPGEEGKDEGEREGKKGVRFPDNVTWYNFIDYLLVPTLVYELEYPRTTSIRPLYLLEKVTATFGTFSLLVLIVEHYVLPVNTGAGDASFVSNLLDLALPFTLCYILIFFIIFECILNFFAEITYFSDRAFYSDWWNSISFDEFSRKWNRPVHTFLLRHVYATSISAYRLSKFSAAFVTFLLSALVHELVMAVVTKKIRLYLFAMQMAQLPLIMLGRAKIFRQHPALGNLFFWTGLLAGFPLLAVCYIRF
ncbi:hypothetical protein JCM6882_009113 [Rhodosporidiobolus microsporus]